MADPIREALELVASSLIQAGWSAAGSSAQNEAHAARATLAAQPPASNGGEVKDKDLPQIADYILRLAAIIREVDGSHSLGAASLAEAILTHPDSRWCLTAPQSISASERPWERDGWCDDLGRCWLLLYPDDGFFVPAWRLDNPRSYELPNRAVSLPAHALPLPGGEGE